METVFPNVLAAWASMTAGCIWGAISGLFFQREEWLGGYGSFRRRLLRLGHVACFGLAFVNLAFVGTCAGGYLPTEWQAYLGASMIVGLCTMPSACLLAAWKPQWKGVFCIPVASTAVGVIGTLIEVVKGCLH
ncbi:MAG: hypothetical protein U0136_21150 [Bdellovibrionota bacterium]